MASYITPRQWARIIAKAWLEDGFKSQLETDPKAAIDSVRDAFGINADAIFPAPSRPGDLNDDQIEDIIEGRGQSHAGPRMSC